MRRRITEIDLSWNRPYYTDLISNRAKFALLAHGEFMAKVEDDHETSKQWITNRIEQIALAECVQIDSIEFLSDPKSFNELVVVRSGKQRLVRDVEGATMDDLARDDGEQARMDTLLHDLIRELHRT